MASHVVVISTDMRRATVKVSPGTYLTDVLQEACRKLNLPADRYIVKHKQRTVDLSVPYRTSGLIGGAKLELVLKSNTPSAIQVGLQLPQPEAKEIPGGRLVKKFPSDLTLWQVLRQFESGGASAGRNINITARGIAKISGPGGSAGSGQLYYETPVLNIMGRELASFADFQKTLSQLGYNSGSVLIRLSYKTTDQTLYEAMEQISQAFKEEHASAIEKKEEASPTDEEQVPKSHTSDDTAMVDAQPDPVPRNVPSEQAPEASAAEDFKPTDQSDHSESSPSGDPFKPLNIFLAPSGSTPAAALAPVSDRDFAPTAAHAQLHQARLLEKSRNKRLLSDKELESKAAAEEAKIAAVKSVLVKVRFPDNTSTEWQVGPAQTGGFLYEAVRRVMAHKGQPFHLVLPGEKTVIKDNDGPGHALIRNYKLAGRVLVNLVWEDSVSAAIKGQPFLESSVAQQGQKVHVPEVPQATEEEEEQIAAAPEPKKEKRNEDGGGKKIPKWLKLGKK